MIMTINKNELREKLLDLESDFYQLHEDLEEARIQNNQYEIKKIIENIENLDSEIEEINYLIGQL